MTVDMKLRELVKNDNAVDALGLSPWCVAEGADGDILYEVELSDAIKWGLIKPSDLA